MGNFKQIFFSQVLKMLPDDINSSSRDAVISKRVLTVVCIAEADLLFKISGTANCEFSLGMDFPFKAINHIALYCPCPPFTGLVKLAQSARRCAKNTVD